MYISFFTLLLMNYSTGVDVLEDYVDGYFEPGFIPF